MTTPTLRFSWSDCVCCDLCNPAKLAHFEQNGVTVIGPSWRREVCIRCILTLEDFFTGVPSQELQLEQEVVDVFDVLGGARLDIPTCQCGRSLAGRSELVGQLQAVLTGLLHLPEAKGFDMPIAHVMHGVLRVVSRLERCDQCADQRIAEAVETLAQKALADRRGRRRPYTAPAIEDSTAVDVSGNDDT
jgi:hypothetical protein